MAELRSMRDAYGQALVELGEENSHVVVLDTDVSNSTKTVYFEKKYPERFFNFGIQEANMVDAAAGLAAVGLVPFVNTFSFLAALRAAEQIRTSIAYNSLNVKIVGSYGGLSDSYDGASHQSVCDLAVMRSMPNMTVICASDAVETRQAVKQIAALPFPVYLRLCRNEVPSLFDKNYRFALGKANKLREGPDLTLVVTGILADRTLKAAEELDKKGISCRVIQMHTIKPIDADALVKAVRDTGALVTVEEHSIFGGLGSAVAEVLCTQAPAPLEMVGIPDVFAESGDYGELLDKYGMSIQNITDAALKAIERKEK